MCLLTRGIIFAISAPSGTGKSSLAKRMVSSLDGKIALSVSVTTRSALVSETHGVDYFFATEENFDDLLQSGQLVEHTKIYGKRYGTLKRNVFDAIKSSKNLLVNVDYLGVCQLKKVLPNDFISIMILPPSKNVMMERLYSRNRDSEEHILERIKKYDDDIMYCAMYDYVVFNDVFEVCLQTLRHIVLAETKKTHRQVNLDDYIASEIRNNTDKDSR